jgi:hypothetical protein
MREGEGETQKTEDSTAAIGASRATRVLRIVIFFVLVLGVEWRVADPATIGMRRETAPLPWALLAVLVPVALGTWAYEVTSVDQRSPVKADLLWGVLAGTLCYVALAFSYRW